MPTQKKKSKLADVKPPPAAAAVQIKAEPLDIKPLGAFVDDRVELIRQAFMCLKPKEITCLAPDGFQGKSIEYIQEQCLDEVLGISTKRLLSIINSTQCPTDTDSSDDEERILEHISLDEISSDSEVEVKPQIKTKKATKKTKITDGKKTNNSTATVGKNGDKKSEKEMTVLELLELQARARAIRSQLAQEPVTKIELDSDEDNDTAAAAAASKKKKPSEIKTPEVASKQTSARASPAKEQQTKRVRLKRNFRIRQVGDEDVPEEEAPEPEEPTKSASRRESRSKSKEKVEQSVEAKPAEGKEEAVGKSRDSSPEVIPVIPSPETLCISSDSEEEKERKRKASIFVENIEELDRQAKELAKQKEAKKAEDENDDTEEGELSEEERSRKESIGSVKKDEEKMESPQKEAKLDQEEELDYDDVREVSDSEPDTSGPANQIDVQLEKQVGISVDGKSIDSSDSEAGSSSSSSSSGSDGEPEVVEEPQKKVIPPKDDDDDDIVEIHDSSDETLLDQKLAEEEPEKSWGSRWLESNRVAKVMAASRLGNKVRDKLKKKKKKQKQEEEEAAKQAEEEAEPKPAEEPQPVSNAEVGSVEHYKELISNATAEEATKEGETDEAEKPE